MQFSERDAQITAVSSPPPVPIWLTLGDLICNLGWRCESGNVSLRQIGCYQAVPSRVTRSNSLQVTKIDTFYILFNLPRYVFLLRCEIIALPRHPICFPPSRWDDVLWLTTTCTICERGYKQKPWRGFEKYACVAIFFDNAPSHGARRKFFTEWDGRCLSDFVLWHHFGTIGGKTKVHSNPLLTGHTVSLSLIIFIQVKC